MSPKKAVKDVSSFSAPLIHLMFVGDELVLRSVAMSRYNSAGKVLLSDLSLSHFRTHSVGRMFALRSSAVSLYNFAGSEFVLRSFTESL